MEETKISLHSWKASLHLLLDQLRVESGSWPRVAIVGVGNPFRCDDAAGMLVAQALSQPGHAADENRLLVLEGGHAPENRTGELRNFAPDLVLFVDAAEMGKKPGTVQWIPQECIDGMSASTHSLPLSMLARYLTLELDCKVVVLGIQAASNEIGETISPEVIRSVNEIVRGLEDSIETWIPVVCQAQI